jgi:hypothetical protein
MSNNSEEQVRLDTELVRLQERLLQLDRDRERYANRTSSYSRRRLREVDAEQRQTQELLTLEQQRVSQQKALQKEQTTFAKSFAKLNNDVKKLLRDQSSEASVYQSIGNDIAKSKVRQLSLTGEELEAEIEREQYLSQINVDMLQQAQSTAKAEADAKGLSDFEQKRLEIRQNALGLSDEELKKAEAAVNLQEQMYLKQQRLEEIERQRDGLLGQMPDGLQKSIGFAKNLGNAIKAGMGPLFLIGAVIAAAVKSFMDLESAAADFRKETGLTNSQMEGIRSQANQITGEFAEIGVEAKDVFDTVAALKSEFSDVAEFGDEVVAGLIVLNKNFGVSAESAAKVQGIFEQIGGLSSETATSLQMQVAQLSKAAGVAPAKVMADIAESAEVASTLFKGDVKALSESAVQARRLGTNLKSVAATAEKLLDFEGGIEDELTAATYVGGQFNLSRARALAFEGKIVEANKETLAQIQRSGDFRKKDYFTQQQLAKAANMSVEEINKQLNAQEKLNSLSDEQKKLAEDAISKGLDITNIDKEQLATQVEAFSKQQEQQATLEKISNQFMGIASTIGSVLVPVLDAVALLLNIILSPIMLINDMFGYIGEKIGSLIGPLGTVGKILKGLAGLAILYAAYSAFASLSAIPVVGSVLGGIAAAAIIAAGFGFLSKIGDLNSPADGKTRVSTKEGGLFELSPNDDLVAAPGAADALANAGMGASESQLASSTEGGESKIPNLSVLAAPLQAVVTEIKALRADLSAGKIAVYMDAQKVTNGVSKTVDQSTRNSYNLGTV